MQSATQFYLNFNPAFAHHGQFSSPGFPAPYMPPYTIPSNFSPNSYQFHSQQQQQPHQAPELPLNRFENILIQFQFLFFFLS
jgi:hypothetical protein